MSSNDTYIDRLCDALADVLSRAAEGTKDRLAGYVANFDFWVAEAAHCLAVIDGYEERFRRFETAQQAVVATDGPMKFDERKWIPPPQDVSPTSTPDDLRAARRLVVGAMAKFLKRCSKEGMITPAVRSTTATRIR